MKKKEGNDGHVTAILSAPRRCPASMANTLPGVVGKHDSGSLAASIAQAGTKTNPIAKLKHDMK